MRSKPTILHIIFVCRELPLEMLLQTTNPLHQLTTRKISESVKIHEKRKTNYDNGKQPFEDVSLTKNDDFPLPC